MVFQVIRIWFFSRSCLKFLFMPPKFQFWGILPPKFRGTSFRLTKGTSLSGKTCFELSLVQIWRTVPPVALAQKQKRKKKRQWQTGYSPRLPPSPYRSQSLRAGWPPVCSSIYQVLLKSVQYFLPLCVVENRPFPLFWPLAYTTCILYYRKSRDRYRTKALRERKLHHRRNVNRKLSEGFESGFLD